MSRYVANPFIIPDRVPECKRPLCPWDNDAHNSCYAEIDGVGNAFSTFDTTPVAETGQMTVAYGPNGSGKSSLLHHCANKLKIKLTSNDHEAQIIDLSEEKHPSLSANKTASHIWELLVNNLILLEGFFAQPEKDEIEKRSTNPSTGASYLSSLLRKNSKSIIIILPPIELAVVLEQYVSFKRNNFFLLCESSHSEIMQHCRNKYGSTTGNPICLLELGCLEVEDGWKYVSTCLEKVKDCPLEISEETISEYMSERIGNASHVTIRELRNTCVWVFQYALDKGKTSISFADLARYCVRNYKN